MTPEPESARTNKSAEQLRSEVRRCLGRAKGLPLLWRLRALALFGLAYLKLGPPGRRKPPKSLLAGVLLVTAALAVSPAVWNRLRFDRCLIEQPSMARQLFRPAEDCSVCEGVRRIEKLSSVDPWLFEERYAYSGRPVVVSDATANWTAAGAFSFDFLRELYRGGRAAECQFFPYRTGFRSLEDFFNMSASRALLRTGSEPWYVGWSNCDEAIGDVLRRHYDRPYFLPATAETEKTDWIFMGSPGYGAPMHVDDVEYPSWQAQIRGRKKWILEPPRECHYSCDRLEVVVEPGEIIVLDTNKWYHQTLIVSEDVSITIGAEYD
ncbi:jmjC domain-containing protein 4 [Copidosoma floridanum]|uniref:jmjC domain-containing protein 4 n=1 Tax=Copidosoma floridanum TaxID=29053 RepID=UPI0006C9DBFE|nr:jmjC domain-containing protein 4 [Copidosoma floridanum]